MHLIGLSVLSGSHLELVEDIQAELAKIGAADLPLIIGGIIPEDDARQLMARACRPCSPQGCGHERHHGQDGQYHSLQQRPGRVGVAPPVAQPAITADPVQFAAAVRRGERAALARGIEPAG